VLDEVPETTADPSTQFVAKIAPNIAQDDTLLLDEFMRHDTSDLLMQVAQSSDASAERKVFFR
jgi:hypothetical protein